jgi:hypothetical protein
VSVSSYQCYRDIPIFPLDPFPSRGGGYYRYHQWGVVQKMSIPHTGIAIDLDSSLASFHLHTSLGLGCTVTLGAICWQLRGWLAARQISDIGRGPPRSNLPFPRLPTYLPVPYDLAGNYLSSSAVLTHTPNIESPIPSQIRILSLQGRLWAPHGLPVFTLDCLGDSSILCLPFCVWLVEINSVPMGFSSFF